LQIFGFNPNGFEISGFPEYMPHVKLDKLIRQPPTVSSREEHEYFDEDVRMIEAGEES